MIAQYSTASDLPAILIHQQSSLPTPVGSLSEREVQCRSNNARADVLSSHAGLDETANWVGTSEPGFQDVCEWISDIEPGKSSGEDSKSESPSDCPTLDSACLFAGVVDELTRNAVERFNSANMSPSRRRFMDLCLEKGHKRPRLGSCQDPASAGSVSDTTENDTARVEHPVESAPRVWPCPFFVRDRVSHLSCLTRHCLLSLDDVREHLCSEHLEPIYCSICYETFPTARLRDDHMRSQQCSHRLPVVFDGLRDSQVRALQRQGSAADDIPDLQESQWIKIWSVVFSCARPPPSPFSWSQRELRVSQFRRFWERYGEDIIADVLAKHRLQQYNIGDEERNLDVLQLLVADLAVDYVYRTEK
ncbi:hypothetical protein F5883DRAFT_69620 [Diaporthe sp. PMI_573]|nr:hypothetical protein F5883DRAFT_69620 [Diaporthaceae sp. PMI_573]